MKQLLPILFAIVAFTATAQSLTAVPDNLYVVGLLNPDKSIDLEGIEFKQDGDVFSLENVAVYTDTEGSNYPTFGLIYNVTSNYTSYRWLGIKGSVPPELSIKTPSQVGLEDSGSTKRWNRIYIKDAEIPSDPVHVNLVVDFSNLEKPILTLSLYTEHISTGVDDIRIEDCGVQWYTTSGIMVDTPSTGLYIRRQNGTAKLVHVK